MSISASSGASPGLPRVALIRQPVIADPMSDIAGSVHRQILDFVAGRNIGRGATVAIGCSSRGIANYAETVRAVVNALSECGLRPFLFPAMGSHGAATAEGQIQVLAQSGITEGSIGCPIRSSLTVRPLGKLATGMPVAMDEHAYTADAFVVVNRIKTHTEFTGSFESGLMKMIAIGMGKEFGATVYHRYFLKYGYETTIRAVAELVMRVRPLLFGVGLIEDGQANTSAVEVIAPEGLAADEAALLVRARSMIPTLPVDDIDVLVIDEMGKDISGSGFDTKVVGRLSMPLLAPDPVRPNVKRIVVCDLTDASQGNADGVGIADFITARLNEKIDRRALYANALAGSEPEHARIPMVLDTDREAVEAAVATIGPVEADGTRLMRIRNTRDLSTIEISTALVAELADREGIEILREPYQLAFSADGRLSPLPL